MLIRAMISLILLCSITSPAVAAPTFVTTPGTGPDKWASVWLLRRHVSPAPIRVLLEVAQADYQGSKNNGSVPSIRFDAPDAAYDRTATSTTYSALLKAFTVDDRVVQRMGALVHEIEIDAWRSEPSLESRVLEQAFRGMQVSFGREAVTQACYLSLFDAVALALENDRLTETVPSSLIPEPYCLDDRPVTVKSNTPVETLSLEKVLRHIDDGARVVFVDTRERMEFEEGHIPGAINLTLRDINDKSSARFNDADLVIAYCVKDFRGYEAAKALRKLGVPAAIMTPHGMRGWIDAELPVAGGTHLDKATGLAQLKQRARQASGRSIQALAVDAAVNSGANARHVDPAR